MFQLTENEAELMVSQNAIPSRQHLGDALPLVFTEQGVVAIYLLMTDTVTDGHVLAPSR